MASRRKILWRLAALCGTAGLGGCANILAQRAEAPTADLPPNPRAGDLPRRQHAWNSRLRTDAHGNTLLPQYHRVLNLELDVDISEDAARTVELAMRTIEEAFDFQSDGVLHMLGWGSGYFERLNGLGASPIRKPRVLSRTDDPDLLSFDATLVLATDVPSHLGAVESAMFDTASTLADVTVEHRLGDVFTVREQRTGFIGEGLPAEHATSEGIDADIPDDAPMFTGFFSGRAGTQASEEGVTIDGGRHDGGTTMHLSHLQESLEAWWRLAESDQVEQMFSAEFSPEDVFGRDSLPFADAVGEHAREHGSVGHWEKVAQAREGGEPLLLRRDFNTLDDGEPGVHFLSLQQQPVDFEKTRDAMNGWWLRDEHESLGEKRNNGLLDFIDVVSRANFYVPPRDRRAFPDA